MLNSGSIVTELPPLLEKNSRLKELVKLVLAQLLLNPSVLVLAVFLSFVLYCHFEMDPVPVFQRRTSSRRTRHFQSAGAEKIKRKIADKSLKALTYKSVRLCFCAAMKRLDDSEAHMTHIHTAA